MQLIIDAKEGKRAVVYIAIVICVTIFMVFNILYCVNYAVNFSYQSVGL